MLQVGNAIAFPYASKASQEGEIIAHDAPICHASTMRMD